MADDYHVTYDNKEDAFIIHSSDGRTIKFERTPEGLYAYTPSTDYLDDIAKLKKLTPSPTEMSHLVSTVKEMLISFHDWIQSRTETRNSNSRISQTPSGF